MDGFIQVATVYLSAIQWPATQSLKLRNGALHAVFIPCFTRVNAGSLLGMRSKT